MNRLRSILLVLPCFACVVAAHTPLAAQEPHIAGQPAAESGSSLDGPATEPDSETYVDTGHTEVGEAFFSLVDRTDEFFGNMRSDDQRQDDYLRLGGSVRFRADDPIKFGQRVRIGISLKDISDRLRLIVEGEGNQDTDTSRTPSEINEDSTVTSLGTSDQSAFRTALRYALLKDTPVQLDLDGGLRFHGGPDPYAQIRASHLFDLGGGWSAEPNQYLIWERTDGFGERTRFDINRQIDSTRFMRARSEALRSESSRGFEILERLSIYSQFSSRAFLEGYVSAFAVTESAWSVDEYRFATRYRQSMFRPWLYVELEPALAFPDDRDHHITPEVILRLDVYFDRKDMPLTERGP